MISSYFSTILFLFQNRKYNLHADILTLLIFLLNIYQQKNNSKRFNYQQTQQTY
jgi:hypothetical protein